jgi:ABC-2 type transport system permease protein
MPRSIAAAALRERRRGLVGWMLGALAATSLVVWAYTLVRGSAAVQNLVARFPPQLMAMFGADPDLLTTAGGFVQAQLYGFVAPLMLLTFAIGLGASATTAEEDNRTADLLLALPVRRERVIFEKFVALAVLLLPVVLVFAAVLLVGNAAADLGLSLRGIVAANVGLYLLVLLHGCLALAVGAATGNRAWAAAAAAVLAVQLRGATGCGLHAVRLVLSGDAGAQRLQRWTPDAGRGGRSDPGGGAAGLPPPRSSDDPAIAGRPVTGRARQGPPCFRASQWRAADQRVRQVSMAPAPLDGRLVAGFVRDRRPDDAVLADAEPQHRRLPGHHRDVPR